jgi:Xaa-Pro aminopeptidase
MMIEKRLKSLRGQMSLHNIDTLLVSHPDNRYYLSGFDGSNGYLVINSHKAILATDFRYLEQAAQQAPGYCIHKIKPDLRDWLPQLFAEMDSRTIGFEADVLDVATFNRISQALEACAPPVQMTPTSGLVEILRSLKEPGEITAIRQAVAISDAAMEHVKNTVQCGMSEIAIAWDIEKYMREHGSQTIPFEVIVASGPNAAMPHAKPTERLIQPGEPLVIDIGARHQHYASDLTRTLCLGQPDDTYRQVYHTVLQAQQEAIRHVRAGMEGRQADSLARTAIARAGYRDAFGHSLGHGIGLAIHELPQLGPNNTASLMNSMVFTIEPGIYVPGWGGVRIEDTVMLHNDRVNVLSQASKEAY